MRSMPCASRSRLQWSKITKILKEKPGDLTGALGETIGEPGRVTFLPYLAGERTPHNNAAIRGVFAGLDAATGREALTQALASFEGTVILVSHDRHLLRATVDEFWRVADHRVEPFDGDLEDYRAWLKARLEENRRDARSEKSERQSQQPSGDRKAARKAAAELREKLRPLKKERDQAEKSMEKAQQALEEVEAVLADPELYTDSTRKAELTQALAKQAEIKARLDAAEQTWFAAEEALEAMEAELLASENA